MIRDRFMARWAQPTDIQRGGADVITMVKLRINAEQRDKVRGYVIRTGGKVLDPDADGFIVELLGSEAEINGFIAELAAATTVLEVVRSGALGVARGALQR
jgi:acetolactate synthase small subunit